MIRLVLALVLVGAVGVGCDRARDTSASQPAAPHGPSKAKEAGRDARQRLLARIGDINDFSRPRPLVTLEEFFEGNDDPGSIGYNLADPPEPREFYELLRQLRDREDVRDVRIEVMDLEDPQDWPLTDTIWIITSAPPDTVRSWFPKRLAPSEMLDGFAESLRETEAYEVPPGLRAVGAWYD